MSSFQAVMGYNRIKNINIKKYKELVFPYFLQVKHVHSLLGSLSYTDSQTIDALIKKYCILISSILGP